MANLIAIVGQSGKGKTTSIETLDPKETAVVSVSHKHLSFKGAKSKYPVDKKLSEGGNYLETSDYKAVCTALQFINDKRPEIKNIIIDDAGYLMSFMFMEKADEKGYDKFSDIAKAGWEPVNLARKLRSDLNVVFTYHEVEDSGVSKIKTSGKMLDNHITMEGLFTVVLFARPSVNDKGETVYRFQTNSSGDTTAKSPRGMFQEQYIPNDLSYVIKTSNEYYL